MGICSKCGKRVKGTSSNYLMSDRSRNMIEHEKNCNEQPSESTVSNQ